MTGPASSPASSAAPNDGHGDPGHGADLDAHIVPACRGPVDAVHAAAAQRGFQFAEDDARVAALGTVHRGTGRRA